MRYTRFDDDRLGHVTSDGQGIVDLTAEADVTGDDPLLELIREDVDVTPPESPESTVDRTDVTIHAPIRRPGKVIAAPLNYEAHIEEAISDRDIDLDEWFSIEDRGYFLKAPSSVVGPDHGIELPFSDRRIDHEVELAFVMGDDVKDVTAEEAWDHIFGFTILLDISVRGEQDRSNRKSYDTFTVVGPHVVTADEISNPQDLRMRLEVNGDTKQDASTNDMVYSCADIVQYASLGTTLHAGDIITTGTPQGVSPLADGDTVRAEIEEIGSMTVDVTERDVRFADVDVERGG